MKVINKVKGIRLAAMLMAVLMVITSTGICAFAESLPGSALKVYPAGGDKFVMQGASAEMTIKIENQMNTPITYDQVKINLKQGSGLTVKPKDIGTVTLNKKGDAAEIGFSVTAGRFCTEDNVSYTFSLYNKGEEIYSSRYLYFYVKEYTSTGPGSGAVGLDIFANISPEDGFYIGNNNTLSIECYNATSARLKNATISLTLPEGVGINSGSNSQNLGYINSGKKADCAFNLTVDKDATSGNKQFTVTVTGNDDHDAAVSFAKTFYFNVNAKEKKEEDVKDAETNPRIMVKDYSIPGTSVYAGSTFDLGIDLINTSKKNLYNIKATLSADGAFVPAGGSNSFYLEKLDSKETTKHSVRLSVLPDAEQKVSSITVNLSYEDANGNTFTAEDVISVKVNQNSRLVIGEFVAPTEAYVGDNVSCTIKYFNMGKTTLNNLMLDVKGNFSTYESNADFVGNFTSGAKGDYDFYVIPNEEGLVEGNIIFQYDDLDGNTVVEEIPFSFEAYAFQDEPFDPGLEPEPEQKGFPKSVIIAGIALLLVIIGIIVGRKIHKKRAEKKLEIADAAFELEHDGKKAEEAVADENKEK